MVPTHLLAIALCCCTVTLRISRGSAFFLDSCENATVGNRGFTSKEAVQHTACHYTDISIKNVEIENKKLFNRKDDIFNETLIECI